MNPTAGRWLPIVLAVPFLLAAREGETAGWKEVRSAECGFVVSLPGPVIEQEKTLCVGASVGPATMRLRMKIWIVERKKREAAYLVICCPSDAGICPKRSDSQRLEDARRRSVQATRGRLVGQQKIHLGRYPGQELRFEVEGKGRVRQRIYAVKEKLYQLLIAGPQGEMLSADAERFFASFRLPEK